jgi:hypothetical protein
MFGYFMFFDHLSKKHILFINRLLHLVDGLREVGELVVDIIKVVVHVVNFISLFISLD